MSSTKSDKTTIADRILYLTDSYATYKEFLEKCDINNHSFISDLKKGNSKNPNALKLAKIVRGTGCSGTWLLTGEGEMYPARTNAPAMVAEDGVQYVSRVLQALRLIEDYDLQLSDLEGLKLSPGIALQLSKLTTLLLERQLGGSTGRDS